MSDNFNTDELNKNENSLDVVAEAQNEVNSVIHEENTDIPASEQAADNIEKDNVEENISVNTYNDDESFNTVMESYNNKKKNKGLLRKTVTVGLVGSILCGSSLGLCMGIGLNASKNIFSKTAQPFTFATPSENVNGVSANITPSTDTVVSTINKVTNSIVNISIVTETSTFFNQTYESEGAGSGIIYSQDAEKVYIVTNNHVVEDAKKVEISITGDESVPAKLVGKDASSDLAVISVLKSDLTSAGIEKVDTAVFGDSSSLQVGEYVIAIGNAMGLGKTSTRGIVSAVDKEINIDGKTLTMVQTDAAINPGNSGGALVNTKGEVIGINTAKLSSSSVEGTGYAIPTNLAKEIITSLMETGTVDKPYLGITGYTIDEDFKLMYNIDYNGVFIRGVEQGSAAENAGLQATDIITAFNGTNISTIQELSAAISKCKSGDKVNISIIRNGYEPMNVAVTLDNLNEQF